ncbi:MAG: amidohydrolase family protein, partial [Clostridia bacterium]|nr:amidohydrolase family protein [Clostridia bacterium]
VEATLEAGMRASIATSTMDMGSFITGQMKDTVEGNLEKTGKLYRDWHNAGDGRIHIWYAMRQIMTCSPELVRETAKAARERGTGVHAHLCEHRDEVRFCLETYKKRPVEVLLENGMLAPNFLTAHNVALTEHDISLMKEADVKVIHCPDSNLTNHGFSKTPRFLEEDMVVGLGSDGASSSCLNLFDQMKFLRYSMTAYWGLPVFDPMVMPCDSLLRMVTINGARAMHREAEIGTLEVGKKADIITLKVAAPHLMPTSNLVKSIVTAAGPGDVTDSVINGKLVMENREVLTLDEEKIMAECSQRQKTIFERAGI